MLVFFYRDLFPEAILRILVDRLQLIYYNLIHEIK